MNPTFWQGKNILITGHTGFKGSWLALWLSSLGAKVTGFALAPDSNPSLFNLANIGDGCLIDHIEGDVRCLDSLKSAFQSSQPEIVFHLAAQSLVKRSYENPILTYETNVIGTLNLLESIRLLARSCVVVNVTTDKCYENKEWQWGYREVDQLGGFDPYSNSKACAEFVTASYRNSFFNPHEYNSHKIVLATARAGNVLGGGDWSQHRLIPDVLAAFQCNKYVNIRFPNAVRPWQHVLEPLHGYLVLAEKLYQEGPKFGKAWNFGPDKLESRTVAEIVDKLADLWGAQYSWTHEIAGHQHEAHYLTLDTSLAYKELGWHSLLSIDDTLKLIVDWEQSRLKGEDVFKLTQKQIFEYQKMVAY
jgi:CDP-glucose 4,6-dehydratase